uniref:CHAP domain-containing protein n=1 Tax=Collinsella bouchesdurhonensis TaxID=1907654 RepID=UPI002920D4A3|nr:endolysin [uncultured phage]
MSSASDVLRIAAGEIGYSRWNDPEHGTKYGRWMAEQTGSPYFGANGVPFCAMFVSWVLAKAGVKCDGFPAAGCGTALRAAVKAGAVIADKRQAKPGDIVIFDWPTVAGGNDHTGIVELNKGGYIQTIEGNTSPGNSGSQGNGGGVYRRTRGWSVVQAVIRPKYNGSSSAANPSAPAQASGKLEVDGIWGRATTLRIQEVLGCPYRDGVISRQNPQHRGRLAGCGTGWEFVAPAGEEPGSQTISAIQGKIGATQDGIIGPNTINAMIKYFMAKGSGATELDGKLDYESITIKAMQQALNNGTF